MGARYAQPMTEKGSGDPPDAHGGHDLPNDAFRAAAHEVVDIMADYLARIEDRAVLPTIEPGSLIGTFARSAPEAPEAIGAILADYRRLIEPNVTAWQHPGFMGLFATTASGPGILGEMLAATLGSNAMLWRTSPVATELEIVVVRWLREALGLPAAFEGLFTDTASISSLIALAAAREAAGLDAAALGLAARPDLGAPRVYISDEAHSSIDKACMTLGLGRAAVVRIATNDRFEMDVATLEAAIAADRAAGRRPIAIVATLGTTSSTSIDPVAAIADVAEREGLWLHVDAAYGGAAAIVPELRGPFAGWERADSIVVNPHKWLFVPFDASLFLSRRLDQVRRAFSLRPEYLPGLVEGSVARDLHEFTPQLGRRFRALKVWIQLRAFGLEAHRAAIRDHIALAQGLALEVEGAPDWELVAPVRFSTVCLRHVPVSLAGRSRDASVAERLDAVNVAIMDAVNATGEAYVSSTRLGGVFTIRVAIGNLRTERRHVDRVWELLREAAASQRAV